MVALENFRQNLATAMEAGDLKKVSVAAAARTSRSHLDDVLKGLTEPTLPMCERLARAVGYPLISLLDAPENFSAAVLTGVRHSVHS